MQAPEEFPRQWPTYRAVLSVAGAKPLFVSMLGSRLATSMWQVVLVLFVLERFHAPVLVGIVTAAALTPGAIMSPLTGALLDRYGRRNLIVLDLGLAIAVAVCIATMDRAHLIVPAVLVALVALGGITTTFTNSGTRALVPVLLPEPLWDRANGIDAGGSLLAIAGSGLVGAILSWGGPTSAILVVALLWLIAGCASALLPDPAPRPPRCLLPREVGDGLRHLAQNHALRSLTLIMLLSNVAAGAVMVGVPVLLVAEGRASAVTAGLFFTVAGLSSTVGALALGRVSSLGREKAVILTGLAAMAVGCGLLVLLPNTYGAMASAVVIGAGNGPAGVSLASLRQRVSRPELFGRVLAMSMGVNALGTPVGAFIAGLTSSGPRSLMLATAMVALSVMVTAVTLPAAPVGVRHRCSSKAR